MEHRDKFSKGEELANALSHFTGALFGIAALVLMIHYSLTRGTGWHLISTSVFGATMSALYLSSTFTHILPAGRAKDWFFNIDRIAIYFLVALRVHATIQPTSIFIPCGPDIEGHLVKRFKWLRDPWPNIKILEFHKITSRSISSI